jgi:signal transduction histidine kinase/CheY-like chemotaxis protein
MHELLIIIFIILGIIILSFAIVETRKVFPYVNKNQHQTAWKILGSIIIFFLFGYTATLILLILKNYSALFFLLGLILFAGAIFVFLVVKIGVLTMKNLVKSLVTQMELQKQKETAEAINREKSLFLATMSHEIRTPMNAILGMTNLLLDTQVNQQQKELLEIVKSSGDSLLVIINDILDLSKIESGKITLQETSFNLRFCVENIIDLVHPQVEKKGLLLCFYIEKNVPDLISTDMNRLRQVLLNLINNAIKFTEKGQIILRISQVKENELLFQVQDTGIGIAHNNLDKLFALFSQVESSANRKFEGTGLGLAISRKIVELMGGNIWVESELNTGSTFSFNIQAQTSFLSNSSNLTLLSKVSQFQDRKVLFISTQNTFSELMIQQLLDLKLNVISFFSIKEGLANLNKDKDYELIFLEEKIYHILSDSIKNSLMKFHISGKIPIILLSNSKDKALALENIFPLQLYSPIKQNSLIQVLERGLRIDKNRIQRSKRKDENEDMNMSRLFPANILVAEDNKVNQKVIKLVFEKLGYSINIANNGLEVLEKMKDNQYDLIFMDISMPEMDGFEATSILVQKYAQNICPIIAMTANVMKHDQEKCFQVGMSDFVSKPIQIEEIQRIIHKWV